MRVVGGESAPSPTKRPTVIDLYAGAGGLSLGMEQAGFDVVAAAELDPIHTITHRFNFPGTPVVQGDLGVGSPAEVAKVLRRAAFGSDVQDDVLDALVGGPPCQGFSVGGVRDSHDERNGQLLRFIDLVIALRPRVFLLENVAGLLEPRFAPLRVEAVGRLRVAGYAVCGFGSPVSAANFGVPQMRRRVLFMGSRVGEAPELSEPPMTSVTVGDALEGLPDVARYRKLLIQDSVELRQEDLARLREVDSVYARRLAGHEIDPADRSWPRAYNQDVLTNSLRTVHSAKTVQRFSRTGPGEVERISRLFRLDSDRQARTLRAGTGSDRGSHTSPRPIHPEKNRVITVREAARLHGYPDWFRFHATNWHGNRQIGNSVPPPLAAAAGRALLTGLGIGVPSRPQTDLPLGDPRWLRYSAAAAQRALDSF